MDFNDLARFDWRAAVVIFHERQGELRKRAYGELDGRLIAVTYVIRLGRVRVVSMRKANAREQRRYATKTDL